MIREAAWSPCASQEVAAAPGGTSLKPSAEPAGLHSPDSACLRSLRCGQHSWTPLRDIALQTGPLTTELSWDLSPTVQFSSGFRGRAGAGVKLRVGDHISWPSLVENLGQPVPGDGESPHPLMLCQSPVRPSVPAKGLGALTCVALVGSAWARLQACLRVLSGHSLSAAAPGTPARQAAPASWPWAVWNTAPPRPFSAHFSKHHFCPTRKS